MIEWENEIDWKVRWSWLFLNWEWKNEEFYGNTLFWIFLISLLYFSVMFEHWGFHMMNYINIIFVKAFYW